MHTRIGEDLELPRVAASCPKMFQTPSPTHSCHVGMLLDLFFQEILEIQASTQACLISL